MSKGTTSWNRVASSLRLYGGPKRRKRKNKKNHASVQKPIAKHYRKPHPIPLAHQLDMITLRQLRARGLIDLPE
jgi:hypothetical protein